MAYKHNHTGSIMANLQAPMESIPGEQQERVTKGGRNLNYELSVIQQPIKARACGSGPKSSADRRPVDPPPVLEFYIKERDAEGNQRDITFDYNADFFVYASLEHARPMAQPRGQAQTPPVLTGFPVAGCCYFDRPKSAAYFVFPDLSVRHEGRYRLVFSLYEQIKNEQDEERNSLEEGPGFYHRLEIRSDEFTVFSAKKFPGLDTSTQLSRTVAEQGCRVRIRRDARMRRRDPKPEAGDGEMNGKPDGEYRHRTIAHTPEIRARSTSNSSVDTPYAAHQRKSSNADYHSIASPWKDSKPLNFGDSQNRQSGFVQPSIQPAIRSQPPRETASHTPSPIHTHTAYVHTAPGSVYPPLPSPTNSQDDPYSHRARSASIHDDPRLRGSAGTMTPSYKTMASAVPIAPRPTHSPSYALPLPTLMPAHPRELTPIHGHGHYQTTANMRKRGADEVHVSEGRLMGGDRPTTHSESDMASYYSTRHDAIIHVPFPPPL